MIATKYLDQFLAVFGQITVEQIVCVCLAIAFLVYVGKKIADYLVERYEAEKEKDKQLREVLDAVRKYPEYRKQSIDIQHKLENEDQSIRDDLKQLMKRLDTMEEATKRRERNRIRESLLQSYRYFTSKTKNPLQAWTRMEADAFWEQFKDYTSVDGNGDVHTEVRPAMIKLEIIEMYETEKVAELMHSRG